MPNSIQDVLNNALKHSETERVEIATELLLTTSAGVGLYLDEAEALILFRFLQQRRERKRQQFAEVEEHVLWHLEAMLEGRISHTLRANDDALAAAREKEKQRERRIGWRESLRWMRAQWNPPRLALYIGTATYETWIASVIDALPGWESYWADKDSMGEELIASMQREAILQQVTLPIEVHLLGPLEFKLIAHGGGLNPRFIKRSCLQTIHEHLVAELQTELSKGGHVDWLNRIGKLGGVLCWTEYTELSIASSEQTWRQSYVCGKPTAAIQVVSRDKTHPVFYLHMKLEPDRIAGARIVADVLREELGNRQVVLMESC